jgi:hypothetical protein
MFKKGTILKTCLKIVSICIFIPIFIHIKTVSHFALNIPREDDFGVVLDGFNNFQKAIGLDKIAFLFTTSGEHRILFFKLVALSDYLIFGSINFKHLIFFNVFVLLVIFICLVYYFKKALPEFWRIPALILSFNLFDMNNFENDDFTAGLFNYGVILLFLLSLLCYGFKNKKFIIPAAILQIILIYSGGNGMIGAFFILLYTIWDKDPKKYITSIAVFLIFCPLYFYHYNFGGENAMYHTLNPLKFLPYFITALGANFGAHFHIATGISLILIAIIMGIFYKKIDINAKTMPLICLFGFMLGSLGTMALCRGNLPILYATSSRYLVYSHIVITLVFIFLFIKVKYYPFFLASAIFSFIVYMTNFTSGIANYQWFYNSEKNDSYSCSPEGREQAKRITDESCRLGIYCIEKHRNE